MSCPIEPKAPTPVNKALVAARSTNCGELPQGGGRVGSCLESYPGSYSYSRDLGSSIHRAESSWVHGLRAKRQPRTGPEIMTPDVSALQVRGLTKSFDRPAVDALDLTVRTSEFYALLGPNGAGKTTTLRMVAGLLRPDAGSVSISCIDALSDPVAAKQITAWGSATPRV